MKNSTVTFLLVLSLVMYFSFSSNAPNGRTGAPGENTCATGCHSPNNPNFQGSIDVTGLPSDLTPGQTYPLTVTITDDLLLANRAGFQITNVGPDQGSTVGTFSNPSSNATISTSGARVYVEHSPASTFMAGTVVYTFDWEAPTDLADGDDIDFYAISVIGNGANGNQNDLVVTQQLTGTIDMPLMPLIVNVINLVDPTCFGELDGSAEVMISGGVPPYSIEWSNGETATIATMLPGGANSVTVIDSDTGQESSTFNLNTSSPINIVENDVVIIDALCSGDNSGSIEIGTVTGGTGSYEYEWNNGETSNVNSNLFSGTYTVTITDSNDCELIESYEVLDGISISLNIDNIGSTCETEMDIIAIASPVNPLYQYAWSTNETTQIITATNDVQYTVTVTNELGCTADAEFSYELNSGLMVDLTIDGSGPYTLSAEASGGATTLYSYLWLETNETTSSIEVNTPGTYTVEVTDQFCTITDSIIIDETCVLSVDSLVVNPLCNGEASGSIELSSVFDMDFNGISYEWNTGETTNTISNLAAGEYSVTISSPNCIDSLTFNLIDPPAVLIDFDTTDPTESNPNLGSIIAEITNGTMPYQYQWSTGDSTATIDSLGAGVYVLTVTDANLCETIDSVELELLACNFVIAVNIDSIFCEGDLASATVLTDIPVDLNPTYQWSTGDTTATADMLNAGTYEVTITDSLNCSDTLIFNISGYQKAIITVDTVSIISCDDSLAFINIDVDWSNGPFNIQWSNGDQGVMADSLLEGEISVIITSGKNCMEFDTFFIEKEIPLAPTAMLEQGQVALDEDGNFSGFVDFPFELNGSCEDSLYLVFEEIMVDCDQIGDTLELDVLFYNFDELIDSLVGTYVVTDLIPPTVNFDAGFNFLEFCGFADTVLTFTSDHIEIMDNCNLLDEDPIINFEIISSESDEICKQYAIKDSSGNSTTLEICINILVYSQPELEYEVNNVSCFNANDGCVELEIFGGTQPYDISGDELCDLPAGSYEYFVVDFNGCSDSFSVEITEPAELIITEVEKQNETPGQSDGFIDVTVTGGIPPYQYNWTENGATVSTFEDLINFPASQYELTVMDANGCVSILSTFIDIFNSINQDELLDIKLVQNPVNQEIKLENIPLGSSIRILTMEGKEHYFAMNNQSENVEIIVSDWAAGTYLCFIESEGRRRLIKVIKS